MAIPASNNISLWTREWNSAKTDGTILVFAGFVWLGILPLIVPSATSDRGIFISVSERLLAGDTLYSQVYDNKEPIFFYLVALQRLLPFGDLVAEIAMVGISAASTYVLARGIASRRAAIAVALIAVPIILTGKFYHPGYTHLPGICLSLLSCALCAKGRVVPAGLCFGLLLFLKVPIVPVAGVGCGCYLLARRQRFAIVLFGTAAGLTALAVVIVLLLRSEFFPYLGALKDNVAYSQGALVDRTSLLGSLKSHLQRVEIRSAFPLLLATGAAILAAVPFLHKQGAAAAVAACVTSLVGAVVVLAVTGMWPHHNQILYIPAVLAAVCLAPALDWALARARLVALVVLMGTAVCLGVSGPKRFVSKARSLPDAIASLRDLSPEARRLLAYTPAGAYARLGQNDDRGHAYGLRAWSLACPRFAQYPFEPEVLLTQVLGCAPTASTLIVAPSLSPVENSPAWNEFVARAEQIIAEGYKCDAGAGLRICHRGSPTKVE